EAALTRGHAALIEPEQSALHSCGARPFAAALSVPIAKVALLELHAREPGALDDHVARVLGSLAPWLAARIRASSREREGQARARADALRIDAERASKTKTEFLNLLSHELRAPLFPIIALSDLLLRTDDARLRPAEWREQIRMINGAGKQMLQLVSDLLEISR